MRQHQQQQQQQMALSRQRLLTLVYDEMETVRMVCTRTFVSPFYLRLTQCSQSFRTLLSYAHVQCASLLNYISHPSQELDALARDWAKPPPDAHFSLRVPIDYVHIQTAVRFAHAILHINPFLICCSALSREIMSTYATLFSLYPCLTQV